jgi:ADP-heptose:LPS heptosyltransferase
VVSPHTQSATAPAAARRGRVLIARLDGTGDVLLAGGAVRAVAASAASVTMLVDPEEAATAWMLPGVDAVIGFEAGWLGHDSPPVRQPAVKTLLRRVRRGRFDLALILTSDSQSPLPLALLLRLAGVGWIGATTDDHAGSLLDLHHAAPAHLPEAERNLSLAEAAGFNADADGARLAVRRPLPDTVGLTGAGPYVVFHAGAAAAACWPTPEHARALVDALLVASHRVIVTGTLAECPTTSYVAAGGADDLGGWLDLPSLAAVLERAECLVAPNSAPAHLAAAVGTPVVSLFAPVVPAERWRPYGVPVALLGDQHAACRGTSARECPVPGHPCLGSITPAAVVGAVAQLTRHHTLDDVREVA